MLSSISSQGRVGVRPRASRIPIWSSSSGSTLQSGTLPISTLVQIRRDSAFIVSTR